MYVCLSVCVCLSLYILYLVVTNCVSVRMKISTFLKLFYHFSLFILSCFFSDNGLLLCSVMIVLIMYYQWCFVCTYFIMVPIILLLCTLVIMHRNV